jgi:hypothetical protein
VPVAARSMIRFPCARHRNDDKDYLALVYHCVGRPRTCPRCVISVSFFPGPTRPPSVAISLSSYLIWCKFGAVGWPSLNLLVVGSTPTRPTTSLSFKRSGLQLVFRP